MLRQSLWVILAILFSFTATHAAQFKVFKENDQKRAVIKNNKRSTIYYEKISWDENITQLETGFLFLRDRATGEIYELKLTETEPNSAVFSATIPKGSFNTESLEAEIYSVPKQMYEGKNRLTVVKELISKNALKRKPFLLRVLRKKGQIIDIFDDKEAALAAYDKYKKLLGLDPADKDKIANSDSIIEVSKQQKPVKKKIIDTNTLQSMFLANRAGQENENKKNEELREVLRKIEVKRRRAVKNNGKAWTTTERSSNEGQSKSLAKQGFDQTKKKEFSKARDTFLKASDMGPRSEYLYQQYGISLMRDEKYNHSIVVLELAQSDKSHLAERYFYIGLNYYKLKDYENAEKYFQKVVDMNDPKLSATAAFYLGNVQQKLEKFEESKKSFQYVLDKSKNPEMDKKAEQYIEYGIKQKALAEKRSHRWFYDGVIGAFYDSNIVLAIDGQQAANTDKEGLRFLFSNKLKYRALYKENHELGIRANATLLHSRKLDLDGSSDLEATDPWVVSIDVPWNYRGTLWKRGYTFELSPKYEKIFMDLDNNGRDAIISSVALNMKNKLVINPNWVAVANYEIRKDDARPNGAITNDADSFKVVADFSSIIVLNKDSERYLIPQLSYTRNDAKGADFGYTRIDISGTITNALFDKFVMSNKIGYYVSNYESVRTDKNFNITSGLGYALGPNWNAGLNLSYQVNDSNTNKYKKFQIISTFSFSY